MFTPWRTPLKLTVLLPYSQVRPGRDGCSREHKIWRRGSTKVPSTATFQTLPGEPGITKVLRGGGAPPGGYRCPLIGVGLEGADTSLGWDDGACLSVMHALKRGGAHGRRLRCRPKEPPWDRSESSIRDGWRQASEVPRPQEPLGVVSEPVVTKVLTSPRWGFAEGLHPRRALERCVLSAHSGKMGV